MTTLYRSIIHNIATIGVIFLISLPSFAQPGSYPGYQWIDRAFFYAQLYCQYSNPLYGEDGADCANFASQIVNAGCGGLCEDCGPNPPGVPNNFPGWTDNWHVCWNYHNTQPSEVNCGWAPATPPYPQPRHRRIAAAEHLLTWFGESTQDWPGWYCIDAPNGTIPNDVIRGWFGVQHYHNIYGPHYHAFFIGGGFGNSTYVYAHNNPHCGDMIAYYFITYPGAEYVEFFGPLPASPANPSIQIK